MSTTVSNAARSSRSEYAHRRQYFGFPLSPMATTAVAGCPPAAEVEGFDGLRVVRRGNLVRMERRGGFETRADEPEIRREVLHAKALHRLPGIRCHDVEELGEGSLDCADQVG